MMKKYGNNLRIQMSEDSSKNTMIAIALIVILIAITWVWKGGFSAPSVKPGGEMLFIGAGAVTIALLVGFYYVYKRS